MSMKAISLKNPWAGWIYHGQKTIETRKWRTSYRGDLLICCSKTFDKRVLEGKYNLECYIQGRAICVVELYDIVKMTEEHQIEAMCQVYKGAFAWLIRNVRKIEPVGIKGQLRLFDVPAGIQIKYI